MILDERTMFADSEAVSGAAATRNVGDTIDITNLRDIGAGRVVYFYFLVETAPTGATTVEFKLVSDEDAAPATDGSATEHYSSGATAIASFPAGTLYQIPLPLEGEEYERYVGLQVTNVGASALASLVVSSGLTLDPRSVKAYPDGVN